MPPLCEVAPRQGKGALGAWWTPLDGSGEGLSAHDSEGGRGVERWSKPVVPGVYVGQHFSLGAAGKAPSRTVAKVANRTREIRPSGMKMGASGNVTMGAGLRAAAKAEELPPNPTVRAPEIYPDKPTWLKLSPAGQ